ncbi:MAG TPA: hypothetical protein ACHBZ9_17770 [Arsenophonus nasoniae]
MGNRKERKPQESQGKLNMPTTSQPNNNPVIEPDFDDDIPF